MSGRRAFAGAVLVGFAAWLLIWFQTEPRANFDSLVYHTHALEYVGQSRVEADEHSWEIYSRYAADRERVLIQAALRNEPWSTPTSERWMALYQMRPLYPLLVAAAYPVLGARAPMAASAFVTVSYVVATLLGFGILFGNRAAAFATAAALLQVNFTHWLVFLSTDGLAMLLWTASLLAVALYVRSGRREWLMAIGLVVLGLALTRPTGSLIPFVPAICAVAAFAARQPLWRRFAGAAAVAVVPAAGVLLAQGALGHPGLADVIQEIPTRHFSLPDIGDPISFAFRLNNWAIPYRLLPTLASQPLLLATVLIGLIGLAVRRSWTAGLFLVAALVVPVAWMIHPVWSDAGRILAPAWVSLSLGVGLFAEWALVTWREPIHRAIGWATSPRLGSASAGGLEQ